MGLLDMGGLEKEGAVVVLVVVALWLDLGAGSKCTQCILSLARLTTSLYPRMQVDTSKIRKVSTWSEKASEK